MDKLGKKSAVLSISNVITLVVTLITSMIIARYRTLEENGTYTQLLLIINTIMPFALLGIPNSITYFIGKALTKKDRNEYLGNCYSLLFIICFIVGILLFFFAGVISSRYNNPMIYRLRYVFIIFPVCLQITSTISDVLVSCGEVRALVAYRVSYSFLLLLVNLLMVFFEWRFDTYICIYTIVLVLLSIVAIVIVKTKIEVGRILLFDIKSIINILKFSIPMGIATVVGTLTLEFDKLFISMKYSTETLGMYNYVAKELPIVAITNSVTAILLPTITRMISEGRKKEAVSIWSDSTIITFSITMFFACGVFVFAPQVISILYSDKYLTGLSVFRIYTFSLLLRFTYFGIIFNCTGNTRKIMYFSIAGLGLNIIFNYIFYYIFGINGPALATVVSIYFIDYLELRGTAKLMNTRVRNLLPWKHFAKIICINMLMGILFSVVQNEVSIDMILGANAEAIIIALLWGGLYFFAIKKDLKRAWLNLNRGDA